MKILLVEDDYELSKALEKALNNEGFIVDLVSTGEAALFLVDQASFGTVILDIGLPDISGLEVLKKIRRQYPEQPVIMLTARDALEDKVAGLDNGADDYLTKPFDIVELIARLRVIERRNATRKSNTLCIGEVTLDKSAHTVARKGKAIDFSGKEYNLLKVLMEQSGKILSTEQLEAQLYSWGEGISSNAVEVHIHNLRKKLGKEFIKNIRGVGYTIALK